MARDRSIKLIIQAQVDGAKRALQDTASAARKVGDETDQASRKSATASGRMVQSARESATAWTTTGTAIAGAGVILTAGVAAATTANLGFEKSMSSVQAVTMATGSEMDALAQQALDMGAATQYSASEAADAQGELARAGMTTAEILGGGLEGALSLAAAGGLELADAAGIAATTMNVFGLEADEVGRAADVLANGANKSATDVEELGQGLGQVGTVAAQTGLTLEETTAALSMFADAGIKGSDAGTSLKTMLQRLTPQSKEAQQVFDELGFSAYDAQGNFIGLEALAGELQDSFGGLDTESRNAALGVAFGSDAIRGASILMEGGATAARDYTEAMAEQGTAAEVAAIQMDNLAGDLEGLRGAIETALISSGSATNDALRGMVGAATDAVNVYNDMPAAVQGGLTALSGVAGMGAVAVGGLVLAVPKVVEFSDSLRKVEDLSPRAAGAIRGVGKAAGYAAGAAAVGALIVGLSELGQSMLDGQHTAEELENVLSRLGDWNAPDVSALLGDLSYFEDINAELRSLVDANGLVQAFRSVEDGWGGLVTAISMGSLGDGRTASARLRQELENLSGVLAEMDADAANAAFAALTEQMNLNEQGVSDLLVLMPDYRARLVETATDMGIAASDANLLKIALGEIGPEAEVAADGASEMGAAIEESAQDAEAAQAAYDGLLTSIQSLGSEMLGVRGSARGFQEAIDAAATSAKENGANLDIATEAGRANQAALDALAASTSEYATAAFEAGAGAGEVASIVKAGRVEFVNAAEAMGMTREEAKTLADNLGLIPDDVKLMFESSGLDGIVTEIDGTVDYAASVQAMIDLGADPVSAVAAVDAYVAETSAKTATAKVDADTSPAAGKTQAWVYDAASQRPVPRVDADTSPAAGKTAGWVAYTASQRPVPYVNANTTPAQGVVSSWVSWASSRLATAGVTAQDRGAWGVARGIINSISGMWAYINVGARYAGGLNMGGAARTMVSARAAGGIDDQGRYYPRRSMLAGPAYGRTNILWAEPSTRREAYLSDHPDFKAENIGYLREVAGWYGYAITKAYAAGGVVRQHMTVPASTAAPVVAMPAPSLPDTLTLVDRDGSLLARVAVVADERIGAAGGRADYLERAGV